MEMKTTTKNKFFSTATSQSQIKITDLGSKGRVVTALKDFAPGDEIFTTEYLLCVPKDGYGCIACCDRACMGYCDLYRRYFMDLRPLLNSVNTISKATGTPPGDIKMTLKWIALKASGSKQNVNMDAVFDLKNVRDSQQEKSQDLATAEKIIAALPSSFKDSVTKEQLTEFIGILPSNAHKVAHIQGSALFPVASMIEHSCEPNAHYETYGNKITVTAIANITHGQSVSLSYVDPYQPAQDRKQELLSKYHFECICDRCLPEAIDKTRAFVCKNCDGGLVLTTVANSGDASAWTCEKCGKSPSNEVYQEMIELETNLKTKPLAEVPFNDLMQGNLIHKSHYLIYRALDTRARLLSRLRPQECLKYLEILIEDSDRVLPKYYPEKAVYYDMLGQVKKMVGDLQGCREAFTEAFNIREKSCGKNSPSTLHAKQKMSNPDKVEISLWYPY